jgi:hypothetical protein
VTLAEELGLTGIKVADWSAEVKPFWRAVIDTVFTWKVRGALRAQRAAWCAVAHAGALPRAAPLRRASLGC